MIGNSLLILLVFPISIFVWAILELLRCFDEARRLASGVRKLLESPSVQDAFPGSTALQKRAAVIAQKVQRSGIGAQIQPEREITSITAEFSARLGRTRSLAGLLIILGLLITLVNLRYAVEQMRATVGSSVSAEAAPSDSSSDAGMSTIRVGIANIAAAAGTAFGYSGTAIFLAGIVLFFSILAQRTASSAIRGFSSWLFDRHDELLRNQQDEPQDTPAKLAYAAHVLVQVARTFQETNTALNDLKLFGGKLESAAQEISESVAALPAQLNSSMNKISGDVAAGIETGLKHQGQYLNSLVTIYSEHAILVKETIGFISRITEANKSASDALVDLRSLPEAIQAVSRSSEQTRTAADHLAASVSSLDSKVAALPAGDLAQSANRLTDAAGHLIQLENNIAEMLKTVKSGFQSAIDDATQRSREAMVQHLEKLSSSIQALRTDLSGDLTKRTGELQTTISGLKEAVDKLKPKEGSDNMDSMRAQLNKLIQDVESLPSVRIGRIFGSGKSDTERS